MRKQFFQDKRFNRKALFFIIAFQFYLLPIVNLSAQGFDLSARASWTKVDIDISRRDIFSTENYNNGFEIGPMVCYRPKKTLLAFESGMLYNAMYFDKYNLNLLSIPVILNIEAGKKAGVFYGAGLKFWYLLNVPEGFLLNNSKEYMSRFLFSYIARIGVFLKVNKLRFQLCPQIEYFQTPLYYEPSWKHGKEYYYLNMVSYNLTVTF